MSTDDNNVWEDAALLGFCVLAAAGGLVAAVWAVATGSLLTLDGILLVLIALVFVAVFGGIAGWSFRNGEAQAMLRRFKRGEKSSTAEGSSHSG
jgi:hypothetical protein